MSILLTVYLLCGIAFMLATVSADSQHMIEESKYGREFSQCRGRNLLGRAGLFLMFILLWPVFALLELLN